MTQPQRYLTRMIVFLLIVTAVCVALVSRLQDAFAANMVLNGLILGVLFLGIVYIFRQVIILRPEIDWLERLAHESQDGRLVFPGALSDNRPPRLLGPMAYLFFYRRVLI